MITQPGHGVLEGTRAFNTLRTDVSTLAVRSQELPRLGGESSVHVEVRGAYPSDMMSV